MVKMSYTIAACTGSPVTCLCVFVFKIKIRSSSDSTNELKKKKKSCDVQCETSAESLEFVRSIIKTNTHYRNEYVRNHMW